ncbi:MAG TPA: arylsulfatase [Novosphingobium sp.]|nr:arylsulfatase [Novosphingobium sp.]
MKRHLSRPTRFLAARFLAATASAMILAATANAKDAPKDASGPNRPNFLIIVTDDLGFSDIGAFGGEIDTPNLDALALSGLRLTGFHTAPACSPTRAMLLTGSDSHRVGLGAMAEVTQANQRGRPGFEGYLRGDTATLAERLSQSGYRTLYSGKWHLGVQPTQDPHARGFQHSFALLQGGHNHFGLEGQRKDRGTSYTENGVPVAKLPADFYSSDYFGAKLVEQIKSTKGGPDGKKPFFAYLAFTAPHFPLQAPPQTVAKYKGRYDAGFEILREQRLRRQRELGLIDASVQPHSPVDSPGWNDLTPEQRRREAREMEIYAAMVDHVDQAVGRVVSALKETGEFDNTVILFLADNGAEGMELDQAKVAGLNQVAAAAAQDFESLGTARSYISYGRGWAQAATAPSYRFKTYATEGGTRAVAFISGPAVRQPGAIGKAYTHVTDVTPTFLDLAGVPVEPGRFAGKPVQPIDGLSWTSLLDRGEKVYPADKAIGNELFGSRSLRQGDWKLVDIGDRKWRLFNVAADPGETRDLAASEPEIMAELLREWDDYAKRVGVILPEPDIRPNPPLGDE